MVSGGVVDPGTEMVTDPVHVCGVFKSVVVAFSVTCDVWPVCVAVVPDDGVADRKLLQLFEDAITV
jgi:hypothetical protein